MLFRRLQKVKDLPCGSFRFERCNGIYKRILAFGAANRRCLKQTARLKPVDQRRCGNDSSGIGNRGGTLA